MGCGSIFWKTIDMYRDRFLCVLFWEASSNQVTQWSLLWWWWFVGLLLVWTYSTDSEFLRSCLFRPSAASSSDRTGSLGKGLPVTISCLATSQHSSGIYRDVKIQTVAKLYLSCYTVNSLTAEGAGRVMKSVLFQFFSVKGTTVRANVFK